MNRPKLRLKNFNYSRPNGFYITICTHHRNCLFGEIIEGSMHLNQLGQTILDSWIGLPHRFPNIELDAFIVMPNHIHGIIFIGLNVEAALSVEAALVAAWPYTLAGTRPASTGTSPGSTYPSLMDIMGAFKSVSTWKYIQGIRNNGWKPFNQKIWQRSFHDRMIRNKKELLFYREYIQTNPLRWELESGYHKL